MTASDVSPVVMFTLNYCTFENSLEGDEDGENDEDDEEGEENEENEKRRT